MQSNLEDMSLQDLSDMVLYKIKELLRLTELKNADVYAIRDLQIEGGKTREAIKAYQNRRMNNSIKALIIVQYR